MYTTQQSSQIVSYCTIAVFKQTLHLYILYHYVLY